MTKKRKIILISLAVTLALAVGVGGFVYANYGLGPHEDVGGNKLLGVGEMGDDFNGYWDQYQEWDTQFIITNPNCERDLTIEWVALIAGDDAEWDAEEVIFEGTPDDWYGYTGGYIDIPGNEYSELGVLSPHEVWQVSLSELLDEDPDDLDLGKYTLEITWSGARYTGWWWWGYWRDGRPLTGWQKEKCWSEFQWWEYDSYDFPSFAISEAEMKVFPSRRPFRVPEWYGDLV